jgi:hypothetical protein
MKRIAQTAIVVSLAMAAATALADNKSPFPVAEDAYYNSLADAPAVTVYGGAAAVPNTDRPAVEAQARSAFPQQSGLWHGELASISPTYQSADAAAHAGYDAWPRREDEPDYWTTHQPGGAPFPGTAEAAREQQRLAQLHGRSGS